MNQLDHFKYVDCVSGAQHLVSISNARFKELDEDLDASRKDPEMMLINSFKDCYYDGAVSSKISRRIIERSLLIKNLQKALEELETVLCYPTIAKIIEAAFKGVWDNCAIGQGLEHYSPKEKDNE